MDIRNYVIKTFQEKEYIKGGKSAGMTDADIAKKHKVPLSLIKKQLKIGQRIELEHTPNKKIAREIARDHEFESEKYYDPFLKDMEIKMDKD